MYVRIARGRFNPGTESDVQRIVEEQMIPVMQALPGFQRYIGGVSGSTGMLTGVSLWDTEEHANFSRDVLMGAVPALQGIGVTLEPAEIYEALVDV